MQPAEDRRVAKVVIFSCSLILYVSCIKNTYPYPVNQEKTILKNTLIPPVEEWHHI